MGTLKEIKEARPPAPSPLSTQIYCKSRLIACGKAVQRERLRSEKQAACAELHVARNATVSSVLGTGTEVATGVLKGTRRRTSLPEPPWLMH